MTRTITPTCTTTYDSAPGTDRYTYDQALLKHGWAQWDTRDDASYFGIWVHPTTLKIFTFAEGDTMLQEFTNTTAFEAALTRMSEHYGPVPPAFISITAGRITEHYAPRVMQATTQ